MKLARVLMPIWLLMWVQLALSASLVPKLMHQPAVLSNTVPHGLSLHYWVCTALCAGMIADKQVKDSLFKNPAVGALLYNAGNIGVSFPRYLHRY